MFTKTNLSLAVLSVITAVSLTACSKVEDTNQPQAVGADPTPQAMAGNETTEQYAQKVGVVEKTTTDPYTGTEDKSNFAGEHPIAPAQNAMEKLDKETSH